MSAVLLQRDVLRGERETEVGEPAAIRARPPGAARIASTLAEQERLQPMLRLGAQPDRVFARAHEIPQGFIIGHRNVDRRELAGAMQPGQGVTIPAIGLDPIAAPFRHARGIDDDALLTVGGEIAVEAKPARARFVHEPQPSVRRPQRPDDLGHCLQVAGDHPVVAHFAVSPLFGERHVD